MCWSGYWESKVTVNDYRLAIRRRFCPGKGGWLPFHSLFFWNWVRFTENTPYPCSAEPDAVSAQMLHSPGISAGAQGVNLSIVYNGFNPSIVRASAGVARSRPMALIIIAMRSTRVVFLSTVSLRER